MEQRCVIKIALERNGMDPSQMINKLLKNWQSCKAFLRILGAHARLSVSINSNVIVIISFVLLSYCNEIVPITKQ